MKKLHLLCMTMLGALVLASCGSSKNMAVETRTEKSTSLEGEKIVVETAKLQGIDMVDDLSEDGTKMVKVAYKWYAGIGKANDKQTAIEMAELVARATISRVIENAVSTKAERSSLAVDGKVSKALKSYWEQMSFSIQKACEPFGDTEVTYNTQTGLYEVTAKVGIRGDRYVKLLDGAKNAKPEGLDKEELQEFLEVNDAIIDAAKDN